MPQRRQDGSCSASSAVFRRGAFAGMRLVKDEFGVAGLGKLFCQVSCPQGGVANGTSESICATACPGQTSAAQTAKATKALEETTKQLTRAGTASSGRRGGSSGAVSAKVAKRDGALSSVSPLAAVGVTLGAIAVIGLGALLLRGKRK